MEYKARSLIAAVGIFIGLLIPLRFPSLFWYIIGGVSLLSSFFIFWVFTEKINLKRLKEDWFTIIYIFLLVFSSGVFAYLIPHPIVQALILGATGISLYFTYVAASRMKRNIKPALYIRNIVSLSAILGVFFVISDLTRWVSIYNLRSVEILSIIFVFASIFVMSEFLFELHGFPDSLIYSLVVSFAISQIVWLSSYWLISYPESERITQTGVPLPAIFAAVYFYIFWGLSHHRLEESLTKKILVEYLLISTIFVLIIFVTAQWMPA